MDTILGEVTISQRRKKLEEMARGGGLDEAYTKTLLRIKAQKGYRSVLGLKVLMWALYSEQPLRAEELCHALAVEIGSAALDPENVPALRTLVASCLGLVTVEASSSTVRLVHFTLQEHLLHDPTMFRSPHSAIAEVCLTYLNFEAVRDLSPTLLFHWPPPTMPFLIYASVYWGKHAMRGMTENIKILALRLLDRFDKHISAQLLLLHGRNVFSDPQFDEAKGPMGFTGLHGVAFFGVVEVAAAVLDMRQWDVNATDCTGSTALIWASIRGHDGVVKMLLEREDINPGQVDIKHCRTPLSWAAERGHVRVVEMLLERKEVSPDQEDAKYGRAPLSRAAEGGHEGVVKMLLGREDVNPDRPDTSSNKTILHHVDTDMRVLKTLLEPVNANPDQADTKNNLLSIMASIQETTNTIKLMERDIKNYQGTTIQGQTPLSWAAEKGHAGVVKMLLGRKDVDPNKTLPKKGHTMLTWAAEGGHEEVVKMLLEREDINPNTADTEHGRTPLSWAARNGYEGIVKMLLKRKDVNTTTPDKENQTPLDLALSQEHDGIVMTILEWDNSYYHTTEPGS